MARKSIFSRARSAYTSGKKKARAVANKAKSNYKAKQQYKATKKYVKKQNKKNKRADRKAAKEQKKQSRKNAASSFFSKARAVATKAKSNYKANQQYKATKKFVKKQNKKIAKQNRKENRAVFFGNVQSRFSQIGLGALAIGNKPAELFSSVKDKATDFADNVKDKVTGLLNFGGWVDKAQDVYEAATAPFTKTAETASKFKSILMFAGLALIAFVLRKVFKK